MEILKSLKKSSEQKAKTCEMMEAIRIKKKIESEVLNLPILKQLIGKTVEIIMLIEPEKDHPVKEKQADWRTKMKIQPKLLVEPEKIIEPAEDVWEGYL
ncbi:hypothetical protein QUF80_02390 [Desulfococcaceae bacterium HSG8]|nr:hypothetical protein [Desulfococcaceae bacterium HSG8]